MRPWLSPERSGLPGEAYKLPPEHSGLPGEAIAVIKAFWTIRRGNNFPQSYKLRQQLSTKVQDYRVRPLSEVPDVKCQN